MKITRVTAKAERTVPHPHLSYSNIRVGLELEATVENGESATIEDIDDLQQRVDMEVTERALRLTERTSLLERADWTQAALDRVNEELERKQAELAHLNTEVDKASRVRVPVVKCQECAGSGVEKYTTDGRCPKCDDGWVELDSDIPF